MATLVIALNDEELTSVKEYVNVDVLLLTDDGSHTETIFAVELTGSTDDLTAVLHELYDRHQWPLHLVIAHLAEVYKDSPA